jgi:hypothetical protein
MRNAAAFRSSAWFSDGRYTLQTPRSETNHRCNRRAALTAACLCQTQGAVWFRAESSSRQPSVATTFRYAASTEVPWHSPLPSFPHPVRLDGSGSPWASPVCFRTPRYRGACAGREPTGALVGAVVTRHRPLIWSDFVSHAPYEILAAFPAGMHPSEIGKRPVHRAPDRLSPLAPGPPGRRRRQQQRASRAGALGLLYPGPSLVQGKSARRSGKRYESADSCPRPIALRVFASLDGSDPTPPSLGRPRRPHLVRLKTACGPSHQGEPVVTVMMPEED